MKKTTEFLAQYPKGYGRRNQSLPDYERCAEAVSSGDGWLGSHQCSRKAKHGPHGAWCKQHDPEAVKAKREARDVKWKAEWKASSANNKFKIDCQVAIRSIAAGHNDPRGLAQEIIDELEGKL
tara:strand:- start:132 stop:500 length:369 start_codon:yes stop_codon:yes gene_type:complete